MNMHNQTEESKKTFEEIWATYQIVLQENYMFHKELYTNLSTLVKQHFQHRPISVLDLACGDAIFMKPILAGNTITNYYGIDLAEPVLDLAKQNLKSLTIPKTFLCHDFSDCFGSLTQSYDLIFIGFSLHHLPSVKEKKVFLKNCLRKLNPHGLLVVIDIVTRKNEAISSWFSRYAVYINEQQCALNIEQRNQVMHHVQNHDFPASIECYEQLGQEAGFKVFSAKTEGDFFALMHFSI